MTTDHWCREQVELDTPDPDRPAVIDCDRRVTSLHGRPVAHRRHERTITQADGSRVRLEWTREEGP